MGSFKPGAAALCISRDVPCLPVAIVGASEAMPTARTGPNAAGRRSTSTFGEPMRAEDGETVAQFSARIAKEVRGLVDYTMTYRAERTLEPGMTRTSTGAPTSST